MNWFHKSPKQKRIRITNTGLGNFIDVVDADTGKSLDLRIVDLHLDAPVNELTTATIVVQVDEVDVELPVEQVRVEPEV